MCRGRELAGAAGHSPNQLDLLLKPNPAPLPGKVTYGERRKAGGSNMYQGHAAEITHSVKELYDLEKQTQNSFISLRYNIQPVKL